MLIAIEGIDGSGKGTQASALAARINDSGVNTLTLRFPQYDETLFGREVGRYLNGDFGNLDAVHPKFSSLLYALDRFQAVERINSAVAKGTVVICDRYTGSNIAHQAARVSAQERDAMVGWIRLVEEEILHIPKPDLVLFLDVEVKRSQELVAKKPKRSYTDRTHDLHEESVDHLQTALENFRELAIRFGWKKVICNSEDGNMRSPDNICDELYREYKYARSIR